MKLPQPETMHKDLFTLPILVAHLITHYAPTECRQQIDLESLEEISPQLVDKTLRMRYCDSVWQAEIQTGDARPARPLFVLVLTEFQSRPKWYMPVRMLHYMTAIYLRLIERNQENKMVLPLFLPFVIYNGDRFWKDPFNVADLIVPVDVELARRVFGLQNFWLIDLRRLPLAGQVNNLIELMARTQQDIASGSAEQIKHMLELATEYLRRQNHQVLTAKFSQWVTYFIYRHAEDLIVEMKLNVTEIDRIDNMEMVRESWRKIYSEIRAQGNAEGKAIGVAEGKAIGVAEGKAIGVAEGKAIGVAEGKAKELENLRKLLSGQITLKFGAAGSQQVQEQLESIENSAQIHLIFEWVIECDDMDDFTHRLDTLTAS